MNGERNLDITKRTAILIAGLTVLHITALFGISLIVQEPEVRLWGTGITSSLGLIGIILIIKMARTGLREPGDDLLVALRDNRKLFWLSTIALLIVGGVSSLVILLNMNDYKGFAIKATIDNLQLWLLVYLVNPLIWRHLPNHPAM